MLKPTIRKSLKDNTEKEIFHAENVISIDQNLLFLKDKKFAKIFQETYENDKEMRRVWRVHIFLWCFKNGLNLKGDLIECGVFRGFSSAVSAKYTNFNNQNKTLYLFDTWDGIPDDQLEERETRVAIMDRYKDPSNLEKVKERFKEFENVKIIKGKVPDILHKTNLPSCISFLHLDLNSSKGEIGALEVLFSKMVTGAICLLDDFGFKIALKQTLKEFQWFEKRGYSICELPTGQALVIKT